MFYLTADQVINIDRSPESVEIEAEFRKIGGFGILDYHYKHSKMANLFYPNHPYIKDFRESLNFLVTEFGVSSI